MRDEKSAERRDRDRDNKTAESHDRRDRKNGKRAEFDSRDKQKVKRYFSERKPRAKRIDRDRINVTVGVAIPGSIALYPLPAGILVAAGGCPLQYFLWRDDLVVVDSCSREVVDIVPGIWLIGRKNFKTRGPGKPGLSFVAIWHRSSRASCGSATAPAPSRRS